MSPPGPSWPIRRVGVVAGHTREVRRRGAIECLVAACLFGAAAPAASVLAADVPALVLAGLLYLGAGVAVVPAAIRLPFDRPALRAGARPLATAVVVGGGLGPVLLVAGLARVDASTASILLNLELVATVVLAGAFFGEHLGARVIAGAALVTAGGVLLVWDPDAAGLQAGGLLIAGACLCWGVDNCVTATIDRIAPEHVVLAKGAIAGSVNLALGLLVTGFAGSAGQVLAALGVGAAGYGASIVLWVRGARSLGAARGQVIFAAAPFIGAAIAWIVLDEPVEAVQLVAIVLAGAGVLVSLRSEHEHVHHHEALEHDHEHVHDEHHGHDHDGDVPEHHRHPHRHAPMVHAHPHVPDLHHRHPH